MNQVQISTSNKVGSRMLGNDPEEEPKVKVIAAISKDIVNADSEAAPSVATGSASSLSLKADSDEPIKTGANAGTKTDAKIETDAKAAATPKANRR